MRKTREETGGHGGRTDGAAGGGGRARFHAAGPDLSARQRWLVFAALLMSYAVFAVLLNSVGIVILQAIRYFGVAKTTASSLEAFKDLSIAGVSFAFAAFIPRLGYRRALVIAMMAVSLALFAMPVADRFFMAQLLFLVTGASFALVKVTTYAAIGLLSRDGRDHQFRMNLLEGVFMLGVLSAYWLFGFFIGERANDDPGWMHVYYLLGAVTLAGGGLIALLPFPEARSPQEGDGGKSPGGPGFVAMLRLALRPAIAIFVLTVFLYVLIEQGVGTWLPTFNREVLALDPRLSVEMTSIFAASLALGRLGAGVLLRRLAWYPVLVTALVAMAVLILVALPLARALPHDGGIDILGLPVAAFLLPMVGLFMAPIYPAINSALLSSYPPQLHAPMTGLIVVFSALGGTTGSLITGFIFAHLGGIHAFFGILVPIALMVAALRLLRAALARENVRKETPDHGRAGTG
ncbi:MAG: MFS transporter [Alphaproteobacteria bacterium]|nr:MAG: MFS transporter [Alphaproteobacteria bacterium]